MSASRASVARESENNSSDEALTKDLEYASEKYSNSTELCEYSNHRELPPVDECAVEEDRECECDGGPGEGPSSPHDILGGGQRAVLGIMAETDHEEGVRAGGRGRSGHA